MPIDMLSDDSLLEIFSFYLDLVQRYLGASETEAWHTLVHVC